MWHVLQQFQAKHLSLVQQLHLCQSRRHLLMFVCQNLPASFGLLAWWCIQTQTCACTILVPSPCLAFFPLTRLWIFVAASSSSAAEIHTIRNNTHRRHTTSEQGTKMTPGYLLTKVLSLVQQLHLCQSRRHLLMFVCQNLPASFGLLAWWCIQTQTCACTILFPSPCLAFFPLTRLWIFVAASSSGDAEIHTIRNNTHRRHTTSEQGTKMTPGYLLTKVLSLVQQLHLCQSRRHLLMFVCQNLPASFGLLAWVVQL